MPGTFILSLDCEGKWGMADGLTADHHRWLTAPRLRDAYGRILRLFAERRIDATFAFVTAFLLSPDQQRARDDLFQDQPIEGRNWLASFREAQRTGNLDGWTMPELLDAVRAHPGHEIGCHGFSHLPLGPDLVSRDVMRREVAAAAAVAGELGVAPVTFVYPRNLVGHPEELRALGFAGYRDRLPVRPGPLGRLGNLLSEFDLAERPQPDADAGDPVAIPSGHFFNWRLGLRRRVPRGVTVARWRGMLDRAARDGGVVHLWLHPHNVISAPETFDVLADVVALVAERRDRGLLAVETQAGYCARLTRR